MDRHTPEAPGLTTSASRQSVQFANRILQFLDNLGPPETSRSAIQRILHRLRRRGFFVGNPLEMARKHYLA
ncbi:MAG: hypothetical protein E5Y61_09100 [Mesorhizobium sp.]|nr:MAG: hypothetical protein E5Y61_09100 [Mesorhizobium sp.]